MTRNIISLYLFFAVIVTAFFATYVLSKSRANYLKYFSALSLCASIYLFGYILEINSTSLQQMIFWNQIQYFGLPFFSPLWLLVALVYSKRNETIRARYIILLFLIPVITFVMRLTNSYHYLYYRSMRLQDISEFPLLYLEKGPWYYVQVLYILISLILTYVMLYKEYKRNADTNHHARLRILLISSFIPFIGILLIVFRFLNLGIDYTALLMPISLTLVMLTFLKYDFLEVKTLARETIFENSLLGMLLLDKSYRIIDYNRAAQQFFTDLNIQIQNFNIERYDDKKLIELFKSEEPKEYQIGEGENRRFYEINTTVMTCIYGRKVGTLKYIRDITEKKIIIEELNTLATIDEMTKLNNRRYFMKLAQQELERAKRYNEGFSLLMMDIDHFKSINDTYGHAAGDAVIHELGRLIYRNFRKTDILGRLGGEEFSVVLTNTPIDKALQAAEQFIKLVRKTVVVYNDVPINFTMSIGIAAYSEKFQNLEQILKYADEALYEAKDKGRNCVASR